MASPTEENYLKSLYILAYERDGVNFSEIGMQLKVSLPTVNSMMKNLKKQGLVNYEKYKPVSLTDKGRKVAGLVLRKHRLTEMYLVNRMGFGWEEVHEIAEQVEHISSFAFFERMDELLGHPKTDPHGSPIPDSNGEIIRVYHKKLSDCRAGETVKLIALSKSADDFLKFLNSRDLHLGTELKIISREDYDQSMTVMYANHASEVFSDLVCKQLLVEELR